MNLDLVTLVLALVCVGTVFTGAFAVLAHRHPDIGGPGWWSVAGFFGTAGYVGLTYRGQGPDFVTIVLANTLISAAMATSWLGVRAYMSKSLPVRTVVMSLAFVGMAHWLMTVVWPTVYGRYLVFCFTGLLVSWLTLRDWNDYRIHHPMHSGLHALRIQTWVEIAGIFAVGAVVTVRFVSGEIQGISEQAHAVILVFLASVAIRLAVYQVLVTARLQLQSDKARQTLSEREADLRGLIENLSAGVLVFLPDQTLSSANHAARSFFGWSQSERISQETSERTLWHLLSEDGTQLPKHAMPFYRVLATGLPVKDVILGFSPDGRTDEGKVRWALTSTFPENDAQGRLRHVVQTFVDVTSVREAQRRQEHLQQQLAQSQKMEALGTLAGGVAHDFNNILAAILGNSELARQDLIPAHPSRESLHEISTAARRGRELVRQIMAFSRQQPIERKKVSVCSIVHEAGSLLKAALPPNVELQMECPPHQLQIEGDATQLGQVLLNLGTNAIHAIGGSPGRISISVTGVPPEDAGVPAEIRQAETLPETVACIEVRDTGTGMSKSTMARIFEPFFTTKVVGKGTGLGLPVVLGIMQAHGGAITVDSELGKGAVFRLFLPAEPMNGLRPNPGTMDTELPAGDLAGNNDHSAEENEMSEGGTSSAGRVLYLDDDDTLVFLVKRLLQRRGYEVTAFCDQQEAIDAVKAAPNGFDVLLTDYNMPGMSGIDVAKEVLTINPNLTVAVASGYINEELEQKAQAIGVTEVVFKTDAIETFCDVVARLVKGSDAPA